MENKQYFKSLNYKRPGTIKPGENKVKVEWLFDKMTTNDIHKNADGTYAVRPACGCTADIEVLDDRIVAYYSDSTSASHVEIQPNKQLTVGKSLKVFLNDGEELLVNNEKGVEVPNELKSYIHISFNVIVQS